MSAHILLNFLRVDEEIKCEAEPIAIMAFLQQV